MSLNKGKNIISGNIPITFFKFTLPNVAGLVAMSSAGIIDGMFVGLYIGENALAAVNIVMPIYSIVFGIAIMLTIGGAVRTGKYLGEKDEFKANTMFTKIIVVITVVSIAITTICLLFNKQVVKIFGADKVLEPYAMEYLTILSLFFFFQVMQYALSVFVRVDGRPYLSSGALVIGSTINAVLDYIFIKVLGFGLTGAALATGISAIIPFFLLISHFFSRANKLKLVKISGGWKEVLSAAYNGSSELLSEMSAGIVLFIFNWIMITNIGPQGVAAFTSINYILWACGMFCYGVGDSVVPLVSVNYGAKKVLRIKKFMFLALISVFAICICIFIVMVFIPQEIISIFLPDRNSEAFFMALEFASYIKWGILFTGLNIIFSSYFTAIQRPIESVIIASSRGLIFPVISVITLLNIFGVKGTYMALPLSEIITIAIAIILWKLNSPSKQIERISGM